MNLFEFVLMNMMLIFFPLLIYLIYVAYSKTLSKEENNIFLELALFSSIYFVIRYGVGFKEFPTLIINVPLIVAYLKKRPIGILLISIFLVFYYWKNLEFSIWLFILEYLLYFGIFIIKNKKNLSHKMMIFVILAIKSIFFLIYCYQEFQTPELILEAIFTIILLMIVTYVSILLFQKGEEILDFHMTLKELEKEKQIRMSLFQITHEIKNPIAVCKGYLDMFDVNNKDHSRRYIPILKEEIERTLILLEDFLSIQKIKIEKDILDMNLLLEELLFSLKPLFKEKNIEITNNIIDDEIYMNGDYNRLKQVFINVIKNSVEAMNNDKPHKLRIEVGELKNEVEVKVIDNGIGMKKEELEKLKQPFFTTKQKGTGLGVFLSNEIVMAHGGSIDYDSNINGTTVTIVFPKDMKNS